MIRFQRLSFRKDEKEIELEIGLDESAVLDGAVIAFEVTATLNEPGRRPYAQMMTVEIDVASGRGQVKWEDVAIYAFDLAGLSVRFDGDEERMPDLEGGEPDGLGDAVSSGVGEAVADMINSMPVPEPFFGCALKAGISCVIGQTIVCHEKAGRQGTVRIRIRRIMKCLLAHTGGMLSKAAWRYVICVARLGVV